MPGLRDITRAGLGIPLLLVALLAGALGFVAGRQATEGDGAAQVSVITTRGDVTSSPSPSPETGVEDGTSRTGRTSGTPGCPEGCECNFGGGSTIVSCTNVGSPSVRRGGSGGSGRVPEAPDLPGFGD